MRARAILALVAITGLIGCGSRVTSGAPPQPQVSDVEIAAAEVAQVKASQRAKLCEADSFGSPEFVKSRLDQARDSLVLLKRDRQRAEAEWGAYLVGEAEGRIRDCERRVTEWRKFEEKLANVEAARAAGERRERARAQEKSRRESAELQARVEREREACLAKESIRIGMRPGEVIASRWGRPSKVNETETASRISQQWVYEGRWDEARCSYVDLTGARYLYFENGVLVTIQR